MTPTTTPVARETSFANYLEFLRAFRGTVTERADGIEVNSDRAEFRLLMPLRVPDAAAVRFGGTVMSLPWVSGIEAALGADGRARVADLVFMTKAPSGEGAPAAHVRVERSPRHIEAFSLAQTRGFTDTDAEFDEWLPWLRDANLRNASNPSCHFLVADLDGRPASVALLMEGGGTCGIYAVATPPEYRNRGLSTAVLRRMELIAAHRGHHRVCLQVYAGSYAHGFYERLGFTESFRAGLWRRPAA